MNCIMLTFCPCLGSFRVSAYSYTILLYKQSTRKYPGEKHVALRLTVIHKFSKIQVYNRNPQLSFECCMSHRTDWFISVWELKPHQCLLRWPCKNKQCKKLVFDPNHPSANTDYIPIILNWICILFVDTYKLKLHH